jgi:hypothetical protein
MLRRPSGYRCCGPGLVCGGVEKQQRSWFQKLAIRTPMVGRGNPVGSPLAADRCRDSRLGPKRTTGTAGGRRRCARQWVLLRACDRRPAPKPDVERTSPLEARRPAGRSATGRILVIATGLGRQPQVRERAPRSLLFMRHRSSARDGQARRAPMKLGLSFYFAALVVGVGSVVTLFLIPGFRSWFFLALMVTSGLQVTGMLLRAQPPK